MTRNQTTWASLDEIRIGERTVARLSASTVERYRQWLEEGRDAPPVRLAPHGDGFVVRDGRHRVAAALEAGHRFIEAEVRPIAWLLGRLSSIVRLSGRRSLAARNPGDALWRVPLACTEQGVGSIPTVSIKPP